MKKFQGLGRSLSKTEQKLITGGYDEVQELDSGCTSNSDCSSGTVNCPGGGTAPGTGACNKTTGKCYTVGVCV